MIFTREDAPMKLVSWNVNGLRACLGKGISGLLCRGRRGHHLPAGDEDAPGAGRI